MINVRVLFFGATADSVGNREIEFSLESGTSASQAFSRIFNDIPGLKENHKEKSLHFSINQEYADGNEKIEAGDELAVFTAVSGG